LYQFLAHGGKRETSISLGAAWYWWDVGGGRENGLRDEEAAEFEDSVLPLERRDGGGLRDGEGGYWGTAGYR
jgi:hypothetical protein